MATNLLFQEWKILATRRSSFLVLLRFGNNIFITKSTIAVQQNSEKILGCISPLEFWHYQGHLRRSIQQFDKYSWCCVLEVWLTPTVHTVKWSKNDVQYNDVYFYIYMFIYSRTHVCNHCLVGSVGRASVCWSGGHGFRAQPDQHSGS